MRKKGQAKKDGNICKAEELEYPSSIIACYSGEDLRLWHIAFENYHMGYFNEAVKQKFSFPKFLYVNKHCWKIALISLVCSNNFEVRNFLKRMLNIDSPADIELKFVIDVAKRGAFQTHPALTWFDRIAQEDDTINLNTVATTDIYIEAKQVPENEKSKYIFNYLYLLSQPKKNDRNRIDKLIDDINISVIVEDKKIDFDDLSEGEKKLILIECITKVLGDKNSIILLDEPDAHTHIAMKKDLLNLISEFEGQTIMTSHSPMFLNKRWVGFDENNVFYMHDGKIENTEPLKHLAELTDNEIDYFEGSFILSSKKILVTEGPYDILFIKHAVDKFADENRDYLKLIEQVAFMHAGGANNAKALYEQTLYPISSRIEKLVFVFDYDKEGFIGYRQLKESLAANHDVVTKAIFYQESYDRDLSEQPKDDTSYMVEDLFDPLSYADKVMRVHSMNTHKEFRNNKKSTSEVIKEHIKEKHRSFGKEWLQNFKPILNKLMYLFDLN